MKNKGFTLVELLAVLVILGLLITLAVPNILGVSKNVKEKSYQTKIEIIENAAITYTSDTVKKSLQNLNDSATVGYYWVSISKDSDGNKTVNAKATKDSNHNYPAKAFTVQELADAREIDYDDEENKSVVNPVDNKSINSCVVYVYLKNNRLYATFDRINCNKKGAAAAVPKAKSLR